jgi:F0F1-type ATP synthase assembly protein I
MTTSPPNANPDDPASPDDDDRAPMAKAMDWVSRIISASFMMVLPCLLGYFVDQWLGTWILFTLLGLAFGLVGGTLQLIKLAQLSARE